MKPSIGYICVLGLMIATSAEALRAGKHDLVVVGVDSTVQSTAVDHYASSGNAQANTNCNVAGSNVNCNTQASGAGGGTHYQTFIKRFDAVVDGDGKRFLLTCWERWRWDTCIRPVQGQKYNAEVDGKVMWIRFPQDLDGKKFKNVKCKIEQILN